MPRKRTKYQAETIFDVPYIRTFGGKNFRQFKWTHSKKVAEELKSQSRAKGYKVRVVKELGRYYFVYRYKPRKRRR